LIRNRDGSAQRLAFRVPGAFVHEERLCRIAPGE
jgi:hypothetical protein